MMRRILTLTAIALVLYASPVGATVTCEATGATSQNTLQASTLSYTIPANANQFTFLVVHDRSESTTISSITGGTTCVWTLRAGPFDNSTATAERLWFYEGSACTAGATVITVTLGAGVNSSLTAGSCWSDSATFAFVSAGGAGAESAATTTFTSETRTVTNTGVVISGIATNNNVSFSAVGTNQDDMLSGGASRAHILRRLESSGTFSTDGTLGSAAYESATLLYQETAGGGGGSPKNCTLLGVCE